MSTYGQALYEAIKLLIDQRGWTGRDLERAAGLASGSFPKMRTYAPRVDRLTRIADAMGTSPSRIMMTAESILECERLEVQS